MTISFQKLAEATVGVCLYLDWIGDLMGCASF